jgi:hypothetical protein
VTGASLTDPVGRRTGVIRLAALLTGLLAIGIVAQFARPWLSSAAVLPAADAHVALTFPEPSSLPTKLDQAGRLTFSFEIVNYAGREIDQAWSVEALGGAHEPQVVDSGHSPVAPGGHVLVSVAGLAVPLSSTSIAVAASGEPLAPLEFHLSPVPGPGQ